MSESSGVFQTRAVRKDQAGRLRASLAKKKLDAKNVLNQAALIDGPRQQRRRPSLKK
jgi:hypothetical protein